jgi:molybdate transport system substrate-binding protein
MQKLLVAALLALCAGLSATASAADTAQKPEMLVFAAASLTDVLQKFAADFSSARGQNIKFSFGSSATLARQIESGAPADVFVSADEEWMDYIDQRQLIDHASRMDLLGNRLVLICPADHPVVLRISKGFKLRAALGPSGRLAVGDPASVPAGKYAKAALSALGVWADVETRLAPAENVRAALMYVARGEAPLGIVYLTDANAEPKVRIVGEFSQSSHAPIRYPVALTAKARAGAAELLAFLQSESARTRFESAGFELLTPAPPR